MSLEQIPYLSPAEAEAMLNGPALQPPPGVTPKYTDRSTALEVLYVACGLVLVVATTAAALRAYSRICIVKKVQIEDCKSDMPVSQTLGESSWKVKYSRS